MHAAELAGFLAAHAAWCITGGARLTQMVAILHADGSRAIRKLSGDEERWRLESAPLAEPGPLAEAVAAAIVHEGMLTLADGKAEALLVESRVLDDEGEARLLLGVPFRSARAPEGFALHRLKVIQLPPDASVVDVADAFFRGVNDHVEGQRVWQQHADESR